MADLQYLRNAADNAITDSDVRFLFVRILDHLIAQERAASQPADADAEMAEAWIAWEDLQRDHDALRAELEAYKAGIEARPVGQYLRLDVWPGDSARHGRFIPAKEGE